MAAIPTIEDEDAKRPSREHEKLVGDRTRIGGSGGRGEAPPCAIIGHRHVGGVLMSGSARAGFTRRRVVATCGGAVALAVLAARAPARAQAGNVATLKIATVGAGREGGTLGKLFARHGHPVMFSSRHPEQLGDLVASAGPNASAGTVEQAIAFADVVLVVVPYSAIEQIGRDHGPALAGKRLIIDVSNPIASRDGEEFVRRVNAEGGPGLATAKWLGAQKVIRAFNAIGYARLEQEAERGGQAGIPIAGDDPEAVALASGLIRNLGFEPVLVGGLAFGRYLVPGTPLAGVHTPAGDPKPCGRPEVGVMSPFALRKGRRFGFAALLRRTADIRPEEITPVFWCWIYIFCVLSSYYVMRPIREQMGVAGGVANLPWLFTAQLAGMLVANLPFALLVQRLPRSRFVPLVYRFFGLNILGFAAALWPLSDVAFA